MAFVVFQISGELVSVVKVVATREDATGYIATQFGDFGIMPLELVLSSGEAPTASFPVTNITLELAEDNSTLTINWDPPASDGGSPITFYAIHVEGYTAGEPLGTLQTWDDNVAADTGLPVVVALSTPTPTSGGVISVDVQAGNAVGQTPSRVNPTGLVFN